MTTTIDSVCSTLGIDRVNMNGRMTLIEEVHGTNANFLINSILWNSLSKQRGICLVSLHDTFAQYYNVGMRNGRNLSALIEKGQITVVELMNILTSNLDDAFGDTIETKDLILTRSKEKHAIDHLTYRLFVLVKDEYYKLRECNDSVTIIVDDLNHLFDLGLSLKDVMHFVRYLRTLIASEENSELCIVMHGYETDPQNCSPVTMLNGLKYMADLVVTVEPLKSGYSRDASGRMIISWKADSVRKEFHWPETSTYLYKLMDWQARIYAPGIATT